MKLTNDELMQITGSGKNIFYSLAIFDDGDII